MFCPWVGFVHLLTSGCLFTDEKNSKYHVYELFLHSLFQCCCIRRGDQANQQISTLQNICIMVCLFVKLIFKGIIFRRSEMCRNVIKTDYSILVSILKIVEYVRFSLEFRLWPNTDMYNLDHFYWYECNISRNIQSKCSATIFPLNQFSSVNKYKYTTLLFQHKSKLRFV